MEINISRLLSVNQIKLTLSQWAKLPRFTLKSFIKVKWQNKQTVNFNYGERKSTLIIIRGVLFLTSSLISSNFVFDLSGRWMSVNGIVWYNVSSSSMEL